MLISFKATVTLISCAFFSQFDSLPNIFFHFWRWRRAPGGKPTSARGSVNAENYPRSSRYASAGRTSSTAASKSQCSRCVRFPRACCLRGLVCSIRLSRLLCVVIDPTSPCARAHPQFDAHIRLFRSVAPLGSTPALHRLAHAASAIPGGDVTLAAPGAATGATDAESRSVLIAFAAYCGWLSRECVDDGAFLLPTA